jgi:hypothetical protein
VSVPSSIMSRATLTRWQVNRAQLPLAQRILDGCLKSSLLFLVAHFEPEFEEETTEATGEADWTISALPDAIILSGVPYE